VDIAALDAALAPWRATRASSARAKARISRSPNTRKYWEARSAPKTFEDKLGACGASGKACGHCGAPIVRYCNAKLVCEGCGKRASRKIYTKMVRALVERHAAAESSWRRAGRPAGQRRRLSLLTCTVSHSGDPRADRKLLSDAWHRWRAWYLQHYGERLEYAWTIEYTPGTDDKGHVHMHVVALLPFRKFEEFHDAWKRATHGQGSHVDVGQTEKRRRKGHKAPGPKACAKYMAKYTSKGVGELPLDHAAKWVKAQHGMRALSTSRGFFLRPEGCPLSTDGKHHFEREWLDMPGWTPSYRRATAPLVATAGPAPPLVRTPGERAGPASFRPPQLELGIA